MTEPEKTPEQIAAEARALRAKEVADELFDSLSGFDEIAIAQHFGRTVSDLAEKDPSMFGRALAFVMLRRGEPKMNDDDARNAVMNMSLKELQAKFEEGADEAGKSATGDESVDSSPVKLLPSAL